MGKGSCQPRATENKQPEINGSLNQRAQQQLQHDPGGHTVADNSLTTHFAARGNAMQKIVAQSGL